MIWLTWRQARTQVVVLGVALAVVALLFVGSGFGLFDLYNADKTQFLDRLQFDRLRSRIYVLGILSLYAAPPLIGAFLGAPLIARELEAGTHRLVWTQGTTRMRWLATKLGLTSLVSLSMAGLLSLAVTWWSSPIDSSVAEGSGTGQFTLSRISPAAFAARDIVPVGYTAFALAVGVTAGLVLRRSVPAIALTLTVTIAVQIAVPLVVLAHLVSANTTTVAITPENFDGARGEDPTHAKTGTTPTSLEHASLIITSGDAGDWQLSSKTVDAQGKSDLTLPGWVLECRGTQGNTPAGAGVGQTPNSDQACFDRLASEGYRQQVSVHPASHFWPLQIRETGILLLGALLLSCLCFWRIRRDLT